MRGWMVVALLVPLALAHPGAAASADDSQDSIDCSNPATQMAMNVCADKDYRRADDALNRAYKKAMGQEDDHGRDLLRTAERAWVKFRDAHCEYATSGSTGGSIHPMDYANCVTQLTDLRTKQLKEGTD